MIKKLYESLEELEKKAGEEGWGGEFREDLFDIMLEYFRISYAKKTRVSVGGMLCHLVVCASKWFGKESEEESPIITKTSPASTPAPPAADADYADDLYRLPHSLSEYGGDFEPY